MQIRIAASAAVLAFSTLALPAHADNWACEVLLCMSNPSGPTAVRECEPPINRLWKHLAKGGDWPECEMGNGSQNATNDWASAHNCPPQYLYYTENDNGTTAHCSYTGVITVYQGQEPYQKVWWMPGGATVIENLNPTAPATAASQKYMNDYAAWRVEQDAIERRRAEEMARSNGN